MKSSRVTATVIGLGMTVFLAACGASNSASTGEKATKAVDVGVAVPSAWKAQDGIRVGIACDYPPFGFTDLEGKNAGYDAEVAHTIAGYAFGDESKVKFTCVTPDNRIPYLQTKKIDLIISTLGYTKERDGTIDYSTAYFTSGVKLMLKSDSDLKGWSDLTGQPVITKTGTTASTFLENCFKNDKQLLLSSTSDAVSALKAGRGAAFVEDSTLLLGLTLNDKGLKVVGEDEGETPWGLGIRQGDTATKQYVDAVLASMQKKDLFFDVFKKAVTEKEAQDAFATNMPRPGQNIVISDENTLSKCP